MALFKKDDSKEKIPTELEQYYDRPLWQVWLRRILAVIIVAILVLGVFMLGRAVYRSVTDDGNSQGAGQTTQQAENDTKKTEAEQKQAEAERKEAEAAEREKQKQQAAESATEAESQQQAMPRTGDDPTDQPGSVTETLPATGG